MALTRNVKDQLIRATNDAFDRANTLYSRIALSGGTSDGNGYKPLMNPDRRDAATFIFFEAAARYENFCAEAFEIEVRKKFGVAPKTATYLMGSSDRGLAGVMGWASPATVQERAQHLFGKNGFFARFEDLIGAQTLSLLTQAHRVRNRVAHSGDNAVREYRKILGQLHVPQRARKGLSVGRLLMEYPSTATVGDRWFNRFLGAYRTTVLEFDRHVII